MHASSMEYSLESFQHTYLACRDFGRPSQLLLPNMFLLAFDFCWAATATHAHCVFAPAFLFLWKKKRDI